MNNLITKHIGDNQKVWQDSLQTIVTAYNASVHESTSYSPYYLVYGREYQAPWDLTIATPVNQHLKANTQRMKKRYDARVKLLTFIARDFAYYYNPRRRRGRNQKLARLCKLCRVERKINEVLYLIQLQPKGRTTVVHVDRMKVFQGELPAPWKNSIAQGDNNQSGSNDLEAVQSTVRPRLTVELNSNQSQGSAVQPVKPGQQEKEFRLHHNNRQPRMAAIPVTNLGLVEGGPEGHERVAASTTKPFVRCAAADPLRLTHT
jgi:hypothetical protein